MHIVSVTCVDKLLLLIFGSGISYFFNEVLDHTLCFTDYLPSQGDQAGREKIKVKICYEMICITKIIMVAKYLEDTLFDSQLTNSAFLSHTLSCFCS